METESTEPHRKTFARFVRERERELQYGCVCAALRNWDLLLLLLLLYIPPHPMNLAAEMMVLHAESVRHRRVLQMRERERVRSGRSLSSLRDAHFQSFVDHEKGRVVLQLLVGSQKLEVVVAEQQWQCLVHLKQCQVLANAEMSSTTKLGL